MFDASLNPLKHPLFIFFLSTFAITRSRLNDIHNNNKSGRRHHFLLNLYAMPDQRDVARLITCWTAWLPDSVFLNASACGRREMEGRRCVLRY